MSGSGRGPGNGGCLGRRLPARATVVAACIGIALGLAGPCTGQTAAPAATPADGAVSGADRPAAADRYRYVHAEVPFSNHLVGPGATSAYTERLLTIPSIGDNGQEGNEVRAQYFRSELGGARPLVIVLPIFARFTYPSRRMSDFVQRESEGAVHVLNVEGRSFLFDWVTLAATDDETELMELFRDGIERERVTVIDIRRLVDWAEQRPEIDGSRVALVGFSRGAIVAGIVATQEPRLAATVLMMGGAHPDEIIARCDGDRTSAVHKNVQRAFGWDQDELERRIHGLFVDLDPASYPGRVDPDTVLIFEATRDECVPESSREALREAMGRPLTVSLDAKHRTAFIGITPLGRNSLCRRTWDFLEDRLKVGGSGG